MKKLYLVTSILLIAVVFTGEAFSLGFLKPFQFLITLVLVLSGLSFANAFTRILSGAVLAVSLFLTLLYGAVPWQVLQGITSNLPLAILFMLVPFITVPIRRGHYLDSLSYFLKAFSGSPRKFFMVVSGILYGVGSVTNLASVRIVNDMLENSRLPSKFLARSYAAGFAACMSWSPYFAGVTLAITYAGISFLSFLPYAVLFTGLILLLGVTLFSFDQKTQKELNQSLEDLEVKGEVSPFIRRRQLGILLINFFALLLLVIVGERFFKFSSIMYLVSLVSFFYGLTWLRLVTCKDCFIADLESYGPRMLQSVNEIVFFLMVGVLAAAVAATPVKNNLLGFFMKIAEFNTFFMIEALILVVVLSAVAGVHQIVSITILGSVLNPANLGISPISYALIFVAAWLLSALSSPFVPFTMVMGEVLGKNTFTVAFKYNLLFNLCLALLAGGYILIWV